MAEIYIHPSASQERTITPATLEFRRVACATHRTYHARVVSVVAIYKN